MLNLVGIFKTRRTGKNLNQLIEKADYEKIEEELKKINNHNKSSEKEEDVFIGIFRQEDSAKCFPGESFAEGKEIGLESCLYGDAFEFGAQYPNIRKEEGLIYFFDEKNLITLMLWGNNLWIHKIGTKVNCCCFAFVIPPKKIKEFLAKGSRE
jgi:hypothetical protein